jgi:hypothetical protein
MLYFDPLVTKMKEGEQRKTHKKAYPKFCGDISCLVLCAKGCSISAVHQSYAQIYGWQRISDPPRPFYL